MNGRVEDLAVAAVSAADRGFLLGDGIFETMRARGKQVFRLDAHLRRLAAGAARARIPVPPEVPAALASLLQAGRLTESALRLTLTRGVGGDGLAIARAAEPTLVISLGPLPDVPEAWYRKGLSLRLTSHRLGSRSPTAGIKSLGYLPAILALHEAREAGADDALLLDERDRVAEATASNLFWVSPAGALLTPARSCGILPGVTRAAVLELARDSNLAVEEGEWPLQDLSDAREAFTTSSLRGVVPVTRLNGVPIGEGEVGARTRQIQQAYAELFRRETELVPHVESALATTTADAVPDRVNRHDG